MIRRLPLAFVAALALVATALALPASANPSSVSPPWVKASSTTTMTVDWYAARGASRYEVLYSTSYAGAMATSARSRKTSGSQTELTITGLKPGTMYCVTVRGLSGSSKGPRAPRNCRFTMRSPNSTGLRTTRVATYNICSNAGYPAYCHSLTQGRIDAVAQRIDDTDAEVVALQETSQKFDLLARAVEARTGLVVASRHGSEAILYNPALYEPVFVGENGDEPREGSFDLPNSADAAWAHLRLKSTGNVYMFVSAHLTSGKSASSEQKRDAETKSLISQLSSSGLATHRIIIAGDMNSHRNRSNDTPRKALNAAGWYDTYDRSATFTNSRFNSYTGWGTTPTTSNTYGDHVDHVFVKNQVGSTTWRVQQKFSGGRYSSSVPSDHSPVRVTLYMP